PGAGSRFLLDEDLVTAGRHPESHVFLDDVTVSRRHAEVIRSPGGYRVRDVESLNGTYVNRTRIDGDVDLRDGDELQIGRFKLVFLVAP
ncbi:MAG: FHA domain-containing protein, partial [Acidimicrobiia bacterium]